LILRYLLKFDNYVTFKMIPYFIWQDARITK